MEIVDMRKAERNILDNEVLSAKKKIFEMQFQKKMGQNIKLGELRKLKKTVARLKTVINEKR